MGCCPSSFEVSLADLQPLGFVGHFESAYRHHCNLMLSLRNSRRMHDHIRRLEVQRHGCTRQLARLQTEIRAQNESRDAHARDGDEILRESCEREAHRVKKSALRLMGMRSLIDQIIRGMSEESVGIELLLALDSIANTPFVRLNKERLNAIVRDVQHRMHLTREQSEMFDSLLKDLDDVDVDEVEIETESDRTDPITSSTREDLRRLAEARVPATL